MIVFAQLEQVKLLPNVTNGVGDAVDCKKEDTDSDWLRCVTNKCLVSMLAADSCKFNAATARPVWCLICVVGFSSERWFDKLQSAGWLSLLESMIGYAVATSAEGNDCWFRGGGFRGVACGCWSAWLATGLFCFVSRILVKEESLMPGLQYYTYQPTYGARWGLFCFGFDVFLWCWSLRLF
ncbi:hypothetical protein L6452_41339 [Arctium lappa]|uniref:Uncharacterized protein n=1 Tax=Arctium lappa TaxID=4217 RepID=A0ACB8XPZ4_ARCLA|nr:hypothetical protein L6452_41339 [Arctium lappa]